MTDDQGWNKSVEASVAGADYPEPFDPNNNPKSQRWTGSEEYKPYMELFKTRPEYADETAGKKSKKGDCGAVETVPCLPGHFVV